MNARFVRDTTMALSVLAIGVVACESPLDELGLVRSEGRSADLVGEVDGFLSNAVLNECRGHPIAAFHAAMGPLALFTWHAATYAAFTGWIQQSP